MFRCAASPLAENSRTVGVVNEERDVRWQLAEVFINRRGFATVGKEAVGDEQEF